VYSCPIFYADLTPWHEKFCYKDFDRPDHPQYVTRILN
jgi:hypothetical protein